MEWKCISDRIPKLELEKESKIYKQENRASYKKKQKTARAYQVIGDMNGRVKKRRKDTEGTEGRL